MDFEEFVTLLGPKLTASGMPDKFNGTDFDSVFWKVLIFLTYFTKGFDRGDKVETDFRAELCLDTKMSHKTCFNCSPLCR